MKKKCTGWVFDIALLIMIGLGFAFPQSLAVMIVAVWGWMNIVVLVLAILLGGVAQWLHMRAGYSGLSDDLRKLFLLAHPCSFFYRLCSWLIFLLMVWCLIFSGMMVTAYALLVLVLIFNLVRCSLLYYSGIPSCHVPQP
ncbi:DNZ54_00345 family protein [Citrobacter portucalensis]|uniref:DNZ54_00345 family protein n=1 Tax=Citrobacter portucalensis TaxID=1639133 RepID=UPI00226B9480|nr:DNZ54_00345 family protein [Citrobacter portucalensis]MCX9038818.1 DNZ54_00345 family protein [Citrobacter portucalensis]